MKEPDWLLRTVEWYSVATDDFAGEFELPPMGLSELQEQWGRPADDPMVEPHAINECQASFLHGVAGPALEFDFTRFAYYLSAVTTDWDAAWRDGGYMSFYPPPRRLPAFPESRKVRPKTPE